MSSWPILHLLGTSAKARATQLFRRLCNTDSWSISVGPACIGSWPIYLLGKAGRRFDEYSRVPASQGRANPKSKSKLSKKNENLK